MHSHTTRRSFLALLFLVCLSFAFTPQVLARNVYEIRSEDPEGDPGDGVLSPITWSRTLVVAQTAVVVDAGSWPEICSLSVLVLPAGHPGLPSVSVLADTALRTLRHWGLRPQDHPRGGRWHDAR